ncbi:uncharacterized protein LOC128743643 [Sabethes cyaneus]|uniref:uncharacterized protein LOC128743643 n=1 Tax=Sabethes cyaneus TaxID=53552 RepID=UPI00237EB28C|nr:uncharacterized protein LOC128743643 [Sabethes cyaneus]
MSVNTPEDSTVNEQFVQMVQDTPVLWNIHLPQYRNRELKDHKWREIGACFKLSGSDAYKKFVSLREKYKRQQKLAESKNLSPTDCWRLYDKFKFLDQVSFSRHKRYDTRKLIRIPHVTQWSSAVPNQVIKTEFSDGGSISIPASPVQQLSEEPSENESSDVFQDNSDYYNDSTMYGSHSEDLDGTDCTPEVRQPSGTTDGNLSSSHTSQFLMRLESKTNAILDDNSRRNASWARCETLGNRVAQTMYALEQNDPDLALKFDIMLSEAITSIKKDQLQRILSRPKPME